MKRWLSWILCTAALLSALTAGVSAAGEETPEPPEATENTVTLDNGLVLKKMKEDGKDKGWMVIDGQKCSGTVIIPATYDGLDIIAIGGYIDENGSEDDHANAYEAFRGNSDVKGISIPRTVKEIGPWAFSGTDLGSLEIHNQMDKIEKGAFQQCTNLKSITFIDKAAAEETLEIGEDAFNFCTGLTSVDFPQHTTEISSGAFRLCLGLKDVFIWNGTIGEKAFEYCENLERVAIAAGVEIDSKAFGEVPSAPTSGASDGDDSGADHPESAYDKFPVLHYQGDTAPDSIKDWPVAKVHLKTAMEKAVYSATCIKDGKFSRFIRCGETGCVLSGSGAISEADKKLPALGHDFVKPDNYDNLLKAEKDKENHFACQGFDWEYDMLCARSGCSAKNHVKEHVEPWEDHNWGDDPADNATSEMDERITKKELSTCEKAGYIEWTATCEVCKLKETKEKELLKVGDGHTYYDKKSVTETEVEPTCLYKGVKVTYLMCDGNHEDGIKTCQVKNTDGKGCADLLAAIKDAEESVKTALTTAVQDDSGEADEDPAEGGGGEGGDEGGSEGGGEGGSEGGDEGGGEGGDEGGGEGGEEPVTPPATDPVEAAREALKTAVEAYAGHLENDHKRVGAEDASEDECVVAVERVAFEEGKHTGPIRTVSSETTGIGGGDYNCTEGGATTTTTICDYCGEELVETETIAPKDHKIPENAKTETIPATCTEPGKIKYLEDTECEECGYEIKAGDIVNSAGSQPNGHRWNDFVQTEITKKPTCAKGEAKGTATCENCGAVEQLTIELAPVANHTWGEWVKSADGKEETRTCSVCGEKQTNPLTPAEPDGPGTSDPGTSDPGTTDPGTTKPDPNAEYTVTVTYGPGGTATVSRTSAKAGASVTVTVSPYSGYELDMIRVTGNATATDLTGSRRSFTMPASNVSVTVSFSPIDSGSGWGGASNGAAGDPTRSRDNTPVQITPQSIPRAGAWGQIFSDIPTGHWAAGEINWANRMGYMNGTEGRFNPDESITCQQMWMVLARLTGSYPANMADARRWAVEGNFADGSSPTAPVARHQLVTALYRCAHLKGGVTRSNASLAGYADSRVVPAAARDAFAWAVSNGIVSGTSGSRLEPNGVVTRAQFAVILYRYSQRV